MPNLSQAEYENFRLYAHTLDQFSDSSIESYAAMLSQTGRPYQDAFNAAIAEYRDVLKGVTHVQLLQDDDFNKKLKLTYDLMQAKEKNDFSQFAHYSKTERGSLAAGISAYYQNKNNAIEIEKNFIKIETGIAALAGPLVSQPYIRMAMVAYGLFNTKRLDACDREKEPGISRGQFDALLHDYCTRADSDFINKLKLSPEALQEYHRIYSDNQSNNVVLNVVVNNGNDGPQQILVPVPDNPVEIRASEDEQSLKEAQKALKEINARVADLEIAQRNIEELKNNKRSNNETTIELGALFISINRAVNGYFSALQRENGWHEQVRREHSDGTNRLNHLVSSINLGQVCHAFKANSFQDLQVLLPHRLQGVEADIKNQLKFEKQYAEKIEELNRRIQSRDQQSQKIEGNLNNFVDYQQRLLALLSDASSIGYDRPAAHGMLSFVEAVNMINPEPASKIVVEGLVTAARLCMSNQENRQRARLQRIDAKIKRNEDNIRLLMSLSTQLNHEVSQIGGVRANLEQSLLQNPSVFTHDGFLKEVDRQIASNEKEKASLSEKLVFARNELAKLDEEIRTIQSEHHKEFKNELQKCEKKIAAHKKEIGLEIVVRKDEGGRQEECVVVIDKKTKKKSYMPIAIHYDIAKPLAKSNPYVKKKMLEDRLNDKLHPVLTKQQIAEAGLRNLENDIGDKDTKLAGLVKTKTDSITQKEESDKLKEQYKATKEWGDYLESTDQRRQAANMIISDINDVAQSLNALGYETPMFVASFFSSLNQFFDNFMKVKEVLSQLWAAGSEAFSLVSDELAKNGIVFALVKYLHPSVLVLTSLIQIYSLYKRYTNPAEDPIIKNIKELAKKNDNSVQVVRDAVLELRVELSKYQHASQVILKELDSLICHMNDTLSRVEYKQDLYYDKIMTVLDNDRKSEAYQLFEQDCKRIIKRINSYELKIIEQGQRLSDPQENHVAILNETLQLISTWLQHSKGNDVNGFLSNSHLRANRMLLTEVPSLYPQYFLSEVGAYLGKSEKNDSVGNLHLGYSIIDMLLQFLEKYRTLNGSSYYTKLVKSGRSNSDECSTSLQTLLRNCVNNVDHLIGYVSTIRSNEATLQLLIKYAKHQLNTLHVHLQQSWPQVRNCAALEVDGIKPETALNAPVKPSSNGADIRSLFTNRYRFLSELTQNQIFYDRSSHICLAEDIDSSLIRVTLKNCSSDREISNGSCDRPADDYGYYKVLTKTVKVVQNSNFGCYKLEQYYEFEKFQYQIQTLLFNVFGILGSDEFILDLKAQWEINKPFLFGLRNIDSYHYQGSFTVNIDSGQHITLSKRRASSSDDTRVHSWVIDYDVSHQNLSLSIEMYFYGKKVDFNQFGSVRYQGLLNGNNSNPASQNSTSVGTLFKIINTAGADKTLVLASSAYTNRPHWLSRLALADLQVEFYEAYIANLSKSVLPQDINVRNLLQPCEKISAENGTDIDLLLPKEAMSNILNNILVRALLKHLKPDFGELRWSYLFESASTIDAKQEYALSLLIKFHEKAGKKTYQVMKIHLAVIDQLTWDSFQNGCSKSELLDLKKAKQNALIFLMGMNGKSYLPSEWSTYIAENEVMTIDRSFVGLFNILKRLNGKTFSFNHRDFSRTHAADLEDYVNGVKPLSQCFLHHKQTFEPLVDYGTVVEMLRAKNYHQQIEFKNMLSLSAEFKSLQASYTGAYALLISWIKLSSDESYASAASLLQELSLIHPVLFSYEQGEISHYIHVIGQSAQTSSSDLDQFNQKLSKKQSPILPELEMQRKALHGWLTFFENPSPTIDNKSSSTTFTAFKSKRLPIHPDDSQGKFIREVADAYYNAANGMHRP